MSKNWSKLGIFTIILTLIGVIVTLENESFGLTIIFTAMLFFAISLVKARLEAIGAEAFALGSIIVWLGFFLTGLPLIAYAWGLLSTGLQVLFFGLGVFLIIAGFTTAYYDLNERFLQLLKQVRSQLEEIISRMRSRIFRSVWSVLALLFFLLASVSLIMPSFRDIVPNLLGIPQGQFWQFAILMVLSLIIEAREFIWLGIQSLWSFILILIKALWLRLKNLPGLFLDFLRLVQSALLHVGSVLYNFLVFFRENLYLAGFGGALVFGIVTIFQPNQILGSATIILVLISLMNLLKTRSDQIADRVGGIQQSAYQRSFTIRNLIRRDHSANCPNCNQEVSSGSNYCRSCGTYIPDCSVCRSTISEGEETLVCPNCEVPGHADHLERWLSIRSICPNCRNDWQ